MKYRFKNWSCRIALEIFSECGANDRKMKPVFGDEQKEIVRQRNIYVICLTHQVTNLERFTSNQNFY